MSVADEDEVARWFGGYLEVFAACGRGERAPEDVLACYDVPLLLTTDSGALALPDQAAVVGMVTQQTDAMRSSDYETTEILASETRRLNAVTALYTGDFSRRRADGSEINRLAATYVITARDGGWRISALLVHG